MKNRTTTALLLVAIVCLLFGQDIPKNEYGLQVLTTTAQYRVLIAKDSNMAMVNLQKYLPGIKLDIRYAGKNNFTKTKLYDQAAVYVRLPVAKALAKVRADLKRDGFDLLIYDAYRPYLTTVKMWEYVKDDRYAATPEKGSRHNRGCAVDISMVELKSKKPAPMPTPYDDFTVKAHDNYQNLPKQVLRNRALLRNTMEKYGFSHLNSEWWHFDFEHWKNYPLMDLSFDDLEELTN